MLTLLPFVQSELGVEDVPSVSSVHDKKLIMNEDEKLVFDSLQKLQKRDAELLTSTCKSLKNYSHWDIGISDKIIFFLPYAELLMLRLHSTEPRS